MKRKPKGKGAAKGKGVSPRRRLARRVGFALLALLAVWGSLGNWYVHHPRAWLNEKYAALPKALTEPLFLIGNPLADLTDGLDLTGHDVVYDYDTEAPTDAVAFAGLPVRTGAPAPADVRVIDRGPFKIGWSDALRHPLWCAYHVRRDARYAPFPRPSFLIDRAVPRAPHPDDYRHSGYDRGHMVPNFAIATRYGEAAQRTTFLMSNIAPQAPALNRGPWRDLEHRIAELWTARYGEIWVVVGCIPGSPRRDASEIDIPRAYFQVVMAQEGMDVRALAVLLPQKVGWHAWPARYLISIDELERQTGLDFNPEMPSFIQDPLEAELPSRLWPVNKLDILRQFLIHYRY